MIGDGFHLPDAVLKVFHRVKGKRSVLVSDAMAYAGMEPGEYESPAIGKVVLTPEGKLHMYGNPKTLAGSASSLLQVVRHMSGITGFAEAWDMASVHPDTLMLGEGKAGLVPGARADLVLLEQERVPGKIRGVFLEGKQQTQSI
jgi:N-acetylglucosamine-6-phosphate deacetylase